MHSPKVVLELGPTDQQLDTLTTWTHRAQLCVNNWIIMCKVPIIKKYNIE